MSADIPTMMLMIIVSAAVMSASVLIVAGGQAAEGLRRWAGALLVHAVAFVLLGLRGKVPDLTAIVLGNTLLSVSFALMQAALYQYQGRAATPWTTLAPPVLTLLMVTLLIEDQRGRALYVGMLFIAQIALLIGTLLSRHQGAASRGARLIVAALALVVLVLAGRVVATAAGWVQVELLVDRNLLQTVTFMTALVAALATSVGFVFMIKERADERNRIMATQDSLTRVANRRTIISTLDRDIRRAARSGQPLSILMIDLDHFKTVNDVYGHLAGDQVLCHVVDVIRERIRAQDLIGRYGGEEFLVVLPDTTLEGARQLAEKLRTAVANAPCRVGEQTVSVTISIGVRGGVVGAGDSWGQLIHEADNALYGAKERGRNRVEVVPEHFPVPDTGRRSRPAELELRRLV